MGKISENLKENLREILRTVEKNFSKLFSRIMSRQRFQYLLSCIRFDDCSARIQCKSIDNLAYIRDLWDSFVTNCSRYYEPSHNLCVDEQLSGFRGNCRFKMYIPSKPAKYGLKFEMYTMNEKNWYFLGKFICEARRGDENFR